MENSTVKFGYKKKKKSVINITSLIDVLFLLLIFLMVSSSFLQEPGIKLDLPETGKTDTVQKKKFTLFVRESGELFLNKKEVNLNNLGAYLKKKLPAIKDESLTLKGDKKIEYGKIVKIMAIVKSSGIKKLIIGTKPYSDGK